MCTRSLYYCASAKNLFANVVRNNIYEDIMIVLFAYPKHGWAYWVIRWTFLDIYYAMQHKLQHQMHMEVYANVYYAALAHWK